MRAGVGVLTDGRKIGFGGGAGSGSGIAIGSK